MADPRVNGFTRVTYLDGDVVLLPRSAYEGFASAFYCRMTAQGGAPMGPPMWEGEEIDGCDVLIRLSEVREVLDVTAQTYAQWKAEEVTGGGN